MCFNASASFALGSALVVIGMACVTIAYRSNKKWLGFAFIPFISGIQQIVEGFIWLQLNVGASDIAHGYSYPYLFIAYTWWPSFVPISVYLVEPNAARQKLLQGFIIAGLITSVLLYIPLLFGVVTFTTLVQKYSVHYLINVSSLTIWLYSICYAATIILPLLLSSMLRIRLFGVVMMMFLLVSAWWYIYAFTSLWCFFAAIGSIFILLLMVKLPKDSQSGRPNIENHSQQR